MDSDRVTAAELALDLGGDLFGSVLAEYHQAVAYALARQIDLRCQDYLIRHAIRRIANADRLSRTPNGHLTAARIGH